MPFADGNTFWDDLPREDLLAEIERSHQEIAQLREPELAKHQPCGCVICTCEDDQQCHGCGAKHCGTHPVGRIPSPVYKEHPLQSYARDTYRKYVNASARLHDLEHLDDEETHS